ncbi:MAG: hypothetical protein FI715_11140, partial [SAR202 cluster bacterium]|nr:hypothetical protein [SAR202 cluster bacterium]
MDTRTSFRNAVQDAQAFNTDKVDRRPGFISSVGRMGKSQKRDVRALPAIDNARRGPVADVARLMAEGTTSAVEQVRNALEVINRLQPELNAFAHLAPEAELMELAESLDRERAAGKIRSPLHGLPISVKDVVHVKGMPTSS